MFPLTRAKTSKAVLRSTRCLAWTRLNKMCFNIPSRALLTVRQWHFISPLGTQYLDGTFVDVTAGYNGTVFAYGQTGSGKTFTMMASIGTPIFTCDARVVCSPWPYWYMLTWLSQGADIDDEKTKGIIPRIVEQIFDSIMEAPSNIEFTVKVSYMEIYMEKVRDLLNRKYGSSPF